MQAAHVANYGRKRVYYVIDGPADSDCLLLSPNGDTQLTSFISFISKTPNMEIIDNNKFGDFVWHGAKGKMSQRWHDVFISKVLPPPEETVLSVALVTEFPRKRQTQITKFANAALEFKTLSDSGLGEKVLGRRLANSFRSRTGRNITGGIRGFVRDAVYDARAIDADRDGWVQEGTQFARRATQRVERNVGNGRRGLASMARGTWGKSSDLEIQERMDSHRDSGATFKDVINTVKRIEDSVNAKFFNNNPIITHDDARIALSLAFPDANQMEIDFLGINTQHRVPRQKNLSPNEQSAVYSLLYMSMLNDGISKSNIRAWSDKYRIKYNKEKIDDNVSAYMGSTSGKRFFAGKVVKKYKNRLDLMYREDATASVITYFKQIIFDLLEGEDPSTIQAFPYIAAGKVAHMLLSLLNEDQDVIESTLGIKLDGNNNDLNAQKISEALVNYSYKLTMYHEGFHALHNVASERSGMAKIKDRFPNGDPFDNLEDFFRSGFVETLSDKARMRLVASNQSSSLAGNLKNGTVAIIGKFTRSIIPRMNAMSEARRLLNRGEDPAVVAAYLNQQFLTNFTEPQMTLQALDEIQTQIDEFLNFLSNNKFRDSSGEILRISPSMLKFLDHQTMENSVYAQLISTGKYKPKAGDPITAIEILSFFEPTITIPLVPDGLIDQVMVTNWLGLHDPRRVNGPSTADSLEEQTIKINDTKRIKRFHVGDYTLMDLMLNGSFPYDPQFRGYTPPEVKHSDLKTLIYALAKLHSSMANEIDNGITEFTEMTLQDQRLKSGIHSLDTNPLLKKDIHNVVSQFYESDSIDFSSLQNILERLAEETANKFNLLGEMTKDSRNKPLKELPTVLQFHLQQSLGRLDELTASEIENLLALISKLNGGKYKNYAMSRYPVNQSNILVHILDADIAEFIAELGVAHASGTTFGYTGSRYRETQFTPAEAAVVKKMFKWLAPNAEPNFILKMKDGQ